MGCAVCDVCSHSIDIIHKASKVRDLISILTSQGKSVREIAGPGPTEVRSWRNALEGVKLEIKWQCPCPSTFHCVPRPMISIFQLSFHLNPYRVESPSVRWGGREILLNLPKGLQLRRGRSRCGPRRSDSGAHIVTLCRLGLGLSVCHIALLSSFSCHCLYPLAWDFVSFIPSVRDSWRTIVV